ncbi:diphosphomevalonate decarboxylase [Actibacterium atlanticum]|uniref:diphosphomevalonate decarboxylase n=1 Tax=Actibacterium atlanticum TaxID=1461693 RepID=A0A058ZJN5_9RHOB|nr:diphosphomevalonate decarboxylase [Actibacterium atlanticum]KCV81753.1 diphosphomevalonate decarboxylase [Actibacterium atlanticum]
MTDARTVFDRHLPDQLPTPQPATAYAPSNIALSKYWGKRDKALNLPLNSSLSISLRDWGSTTRISPSSTDEVWFQDRLLPADDPFADKVLRFANRFRRDQMMPLKIETSNTIPTAAGLASSASGFAALTMALVQAFQLDLPDDTVSMFARLGSGSATRSLWHGFARWERGHANDGTDSFARPLEVRWPAFRIAIIPVDTGPKSHSSRDGMNHTVATSPLFGAWPAQAESDCTAIQNAVQDQNFQTLGQLAEANALAMHATMLAARPALSYLKPESWQVLETLWTARHEGLAAFATMDAGANVKLILEASSAADVKAIFPQSRLIAPFDPL